mgnify:CR=1 FL=1
MTWFLALALFIVSLPLVISVYLRNRDISEEAIQEASRSHKPDPYDVGAFAIEVRESLSEQKGVQSSESFLQTGSADQIPSIPELDLEELNKKAHERRGYSEAFLDGVVRYGGSVIQKHMAGENNIQEGIGKLAGEDLGSFADLSSKVETYEQTA